MTVEEFIEEVHNSSIAPKDFDYVYKEFCKYRKSALETLKEFHNICISNNIHYQLAFGSLLGAIRDGAQIPWDYDVDVLVPISERDRLIECLKKQLNNDYYVVCPQTNSKCRHEIMRITPKGFRSEELHVDVFFLIGLPDDNIERKNVTSRIVEISNKRFFKCVSLRGEWHGNIRKSIGLFFRKLNYIALDMQELNKVFEAIAFEFPLNACTYCTTADNWADVDVLQYDLLRETENHITSDGEFVIPTRYDEVLSAIYGDFRRLPDLSSRIKDVYYHYRLIKQYGISH